MSQKTVLVVDDEFLIRWALQEGLKDRFRVLTAGTVAEALDTLEREAVDAVVTDLKLPDRDGLELIRHLRGFRPEMKVFVITAYGSDDVVDRLFALDVEAYVRKPFEIHLIRDMLEAHLNFPTRTGVA
jgi:two-component system response regulator PilR (NtrC family)